MYSFESSEYTTLTIMNKTTVRRMRKQCNFLFICGRSYNCLRLHAFPVTISEKTSKQITNKTIVSTANEPRAFLLNHMK